MAGPPDENDESWQQRTHVIRMGPIVRPKAAGGDCLVIIYARNTSNLGKRFVLEAASGPCWVGRGSDNQIVLESDTCSRKHASFESRDEIWWVVDNNSTNGTYVNDEPATRTALKRGDHIKIGDTIFKYLAGTDVEAEFVETIREVMMRDGLTQAYNRRHLTEQIEKELHRARRYRRPLGLVMFDLDHFKRVNDTFGHLAGDYVLRETAGLVRERTPAEAIFARYGGEEFALLMPETPLEDAVTPRREHPVRHRGPPVHVRRPRHSRDRVDRRRTRQRGDAERRRVHQGVGSEALRRETRRAKSGRLVGLRFGQESIQRVPPNSLFSSSSRRSATVPSTPTAASNSSRST